MHNKVIPIDKQLLTPFFDHWESNRKKIEDLYKAKDHQSVELMKEMIANYKELLESAGQQSNELTGKLQSRILPLNGNERLCFVNEKISSPYAYIQLDALYSESKKKVARLSVQQSKG